MEILKIKDMWTPRETCLSTLFSTSNPKKGILFAFCFLVKKKSLFNLRNDFTVLLKGKKLVT